MPKSPSLAVALVGYPDPARAQLGHALTELGARIVFEGEPQGVDEKMLRSLGVTTVIVNLDERFAEALQGLDSLLADTDVQIIFNEADVTRRLAGWDLARWGRHLAAKVFGHEQINPPPPPGAEFLPSTGNTLFPAPQPAEADIPPSDLASSAIPVSEPEKPLSAMELAPLETAPSLITPENTDDSPDKLNIFAANFLLELEPMDSSIPGQSAAASLETRPVAAEASEEGRLESLETLSTEEEPGKHSLQLESNPIPEAVAGRWTLALVDETEEILTTDSLSESESGEEAIPAPSAETSEGDFTLDESQLLEDPGLAALAAQFEQSAASIGVVPASDPDWGDEIPAITAADPIPVVSEPQEIPIAGLASAGKPHFDFGTLELAPFDAEIPAAPPAQKESSSYSFDNLSLSLAPLEDEPAESEGIGQSQVTIPWIIVLGASIGGPDALRLFLAGIPSGLPVLFVLVQHLENGFFEPLAEQLQKATQMPVSVPAAGYRAKPGEVLVVGAEEEFAFASDGKVERFPLLELPHYRPCIDDVLRNVADAFGARATAIIFSGMAGDAIEGCMYLASKGGHVWVQDPSSCVVSSMVDGIQARGVAEFAGTPEQLAKHCIASYEK